MSDTKAPVVSQQRQQQQQQQQEAGLGIGSLGGRRDRPEHDRKQGILRIDGAALRQAVGHSPQPPHVHDDGAVEGKPEQRKQARIDHVCQVGEFRGRVLGLLLDEIEYRSKQEGMPRIHTFWSTVNDFWSLVQLGAKEMEQLLATLPGLVDCRLCVDQVALHHNKVIDDNSNEEGRERFLRVLCASLAEHSGNTLRRLTVSMDESAATMAPGGATFASLASPPADKADDKQPRRQLRLDRLERLAISTGPAMLTAPELAALFRVAPNLIDLDLSTAGQMRPSAAAAAAAEAKAAESKAESGDLAQQQRADVAQAPTTFAAVFAARALANRAIRRLTWSEVCLSLTDADVLALASCTLRSIVVRDGFTPVYSGSLDDGDALVCPLTAKMFGRLFDTSPNLHVLSLKIMTKHDEFRASTRLANAIVRALGESSADGARRSLRSLRFAGEWERFKQFWNQDQNQYSVADLLERVPGLVDMLFDCSLDGWNSCSWGKQRPRRPLPPFPLVIQKSWIERAIATLVAADKVDSGDACDSDHEELDDDDDDGLRECFSAHTTTLELNPSTMMAHDVTVADWERLLLSSKRWMYIKLPRCLSVVEPETGEFESKIVHGELSAKLFAFFAAECKDLVSFQTSWRVATDIDPAHLVAMCKRARLSTPNHGIHLQLACCVGCHCQCQCGSTTPLNKCDQEREAKFAADRATKPESAQDDDMCCNHHKVACMHTRQLPPRSHDQLTIDHVIEALSSPSSPPPPGVGRAGRADEERSILVLTTHCFAKVTGADLTKLLAWKCTTPPTREELHTLYTLGPPGCTIVLIVTAAALSDFLTEHRLSTNQDVAAFNRRVQVHFNFLPCDGKQYDPSEPAPMWPRSRSGRGSCSDGDNGPAAPIGFYQVGFGVYSAAMRQRDEDETSTTATTPGDAT